MGFWRIVSGWISTTATQLLYSYLSVFHVGLHSDFRFWVDFIHQNLFTGENFY